MCSEGAVTLEPVPAKGATRVGCARGCRSRNVLRIRMSTQQLRGPEQGLTACAHAYELYGAIP